MTYNPFRQGDIDAVPSDAVPSAETILDPKDKQIAEMQQRLDGIKFASELLEEAVSRNEKKIKLYRERLMRAFNGHLHAKYDGCDPDCP